jgi:hypothetical protein
VRLLADQRFVVETFVVEKPTTAVVRFETGRLNWDLSYITLLLWDRNRDLQHFIPEFRTRMPAVVCSCF